MYLTIRQKYIISLVLAFAWAGFSLWLAQGWIKELTALTNAWVTYLFVYGIAIIPGFMNMFLMSSLLMDKRPKRKDIPPVLYPDIAVLVAAYNEGTNIASTIESIAKQDYPGKMQVIVVNDGSTDNTAEIVRNLLPEYSWLYLLDLTKNVGKANALNKALENVTAPITITIDGDSYLFKDAIKHLVGRYLSDPQHTKAVAGAVLVRNSRHKFVAKVQEWDYFHGIAAIKRLQSKYHGTLVAQGAFSAYDTDVLRSVGAWPHCVGEDIVLTWAILKQGWRVGFAEDAILFTNAPDTWNQFFKQRMRWSRGLIEAFKAHWQLLFKVRMTTLFIWWNLLFPYMDIAFTLGFIPGVILALMGYYWIAGYMTLLVMPLAMLLNFIMFRIQNRMFKVQGLKVRSNPIGFIFYALFYSFILQPASVYGYAKELFNGTVKNWGTK
jgi:biofilm PGA synthesis N-glycosyltransferase PgaC